jgi:Tfp pilus assembly protein PilF
MGALYVRADTPAEAVRWLLNAIQLNPQYSDAHYNLAAAYRRLGNEEAADEHFKRAALLGGVPGDANQ